MAVKRTDYEAVAAGQTDQVLGGAGALGDILETLVVTVVTSGATGIASIKDGNGSAISLVAASTPIGVYTIRLGIVAKNATTPGWKVTTGAGATALATGRFSTT